ncbi:MAG: peptidoglycan-associated lipoprotein [SAR116 cluster bacterium MED-G04]|nr:peptidoglycan-associated lipoprotein [SAR116 cluster bacterium]OUW36529.1 MAG: peptidoglycan-associated lipoprotein [Gammaproteobacteria bacterium TMED183]PDH63145.1 MAG: peptidoglycan-associated lipoprotein [SAR116 cluster bacterium MED-G04]
MINRIFALFAVVAFLAACETAPKDAGDAAGSGASGSSDTSSSSSSSSSASGGSTSSSSGSSTMTKDEELVSIGNKVYFDFDSSALSADAKSTLNAQAAFLRSNPSVRITVEGHADERGTREYNLALGDRRASAARDFLVAQGIDGARIKTISYGKERPEMVGSNDEAWAKNRRSVSIIR